MFLYSINREGVVLFHPDVLNISPNLATLTEKEAKLIVLAYDYDTAFGDAPTEERLSRARNLVYGAEEIPNLELKKYKNAIEEFCSLQYSSKKELVRRYERQLGFLLKELDSDKSTKDLTTILANQKMIRAALKEITQEISEEMEKRKIVGGGNLSLLEELHNNQSEWNRLKVKRK